MQPQLTAVSLQSATTWLGSAALRARRPQPVHHAARQQQRRFVASAATDANGAAGTAKAAAASGAAVAMSGPDTSSAADEGAGSGPMIGTLLIKCPDSKGVVASVAQLLFGFGCNILSSDQFSDVEADMFYQRVVFDYSDLLVGPGNAAVLERGIAEVARKYSMDWRVSYSAKPKRMALLVSKLDHCLYDLLIRMENGELNCTCPIIISNHPDLEMVANRFGVPFRHLPIAAKDAASKAAQEAQIEAVLQEESIDLIVLARYMQIFSREFCERHWRHTINIHHSFLPAFEGARPYHRAHERGVKVIGATAHFATSDLDCGPIITQDVTNVSHRDSVPDMVRKGRDLERTVLAKAVRWHLQDRVVVHGNKTVVFE
ncbi:hypothetical protein D9Q98_007008 [Chlorella vulgaris]|uniref:ACT domain-containing protein n=1 Tax=Chlorella vulgaris TaxID=3077 RepID=A0A9D4YUL4_CHLVU|nr:hypothetical protein D9Q98_007008 [Chlorella vulgaris]